MEAKKFFNTNSTKNCLSQILYFTLLTIKTKTDLLLQLLNNNFFIYEFFIF